MRNAITSNVNKRFKRLLNGNLSRLLLILAVSLNTVSCTHSDQSLAKESTTQVTAIHPRVLAKSSDKADILKRISANPWLQTSFDQLKAKVAPYADRHIKDPQWLLSRMQMHWGTHYTVFPLDVTGNLIEQRWQSKLNLSGRSGNAPVPTVRVSTANTSPYMSDRSVGVKPDITDFPAYHKSDLFEVASKKTPGLREKVPLGNDLHTWNRDISDLAAESATLYFLTGEEKYAALAADVFMQWALAVYFQQAFNDDEAMDSMSGFFGGQDLTDYAYKTMAVSYDYSYDYLVRNQSRYLATLRTQGYLVDETISSIADSAFYKFLDRGTFRNGLVLNIDEPNNHSMKNSELIWMALAIDDPKKRQTAINTFLHNNPKLRQADKSIWGGAWIGQAPWDLFVKTAIEPETGLWIEPPAYHGFPMRAAVRAAAALDVNGYDVWQSYPEILKAQYAYFRFAFPDGSVVQFGDSNPTMFPDPINLEYAIAGARANRLPIEDKLTAYLERLIELGLYQRKANFMHLVYFVDKLKTSSQVIQTNPRSDKIDFASLYLQRLNGDDKEQGLMFQVNGGNYTHQMYKGIDLELYGAGRVQGLHGGVLYPYHSPQMLEYYVRSGAANTVIPNAMTLSEDPKKPIQLVGMEPAAGAKAISPHHGFTDVTFDFDGTAQQRTTALISLPDEGGLYLDIFRSADPTRNDYVYNNVGDGLSLMSLNNAPYAMTAGTVLEEISPGYQYLTEQASVNTDQAIKAVFKADDLKNGTSYMKVYFPASSGRTFVTATAPLMYTPQLDVEPLTEISRRTLVAKQNGSATSQPFIAIFEPGRSANGIVKAVRQRTQNGVQIIEIETKQSLITALSSTKRAKLEYKGISFDGQFAIVHQTLKSGKAKAAYLGKGQHLSIDELDLRASAGIDFAYIDLNSKRFK